MLSLNTASGRWLPYASCAARAATARAFIRDAFEAVRARESFAFMSSVCSNAAVGAADGGAFVEGRLYSGALPAVVLSAAGAPTCTATFIAIGAGAGAAVDANSGDGAGAAADANSGDRFRVIAPSAAGAAAEAADGAAARLKLIAVAGGDSTAGAAAGG